MGVDSPLKQTIASAWALKDRMFNAPPCLTILYYHAVRTEDVPNFRAQMEHVAEHAEPVWCNHSQPPKGSKPLVAITFDDAFDSVADNAAPILAEFAIPATVFVPTGWLGQKPGWAMESDYDSGETVMTMQRLRSLASTQLRLASHSVRHPKLATLSPECQRKELLDSRAFLERHLGTEVDQLAFPYGSFNTDTVAIANELGYRQLYTVIPEAVMPQANSFVRGRTATEPHNNLKLFDAKMRGAYRWMPAAISMKRRLLQK